MTILPDFHSIDGNTGQVWGEPFAETVVSSAVKKLAIVERTSAGRRSASMISILRAPRYDTVTASGPAEDATIPP